MDWIISFFETLFYDICEGWFRLMQWIVPDKMENKKFRIALKLIVGIFSIALLVCVFRGVVFLFSKEESTKNIGRCMIIIPLVISVLQIFGGITIRFRTRR